MGSSGHVVSEKEDEGAVDSKRQKKGINKGGQMKQEF
jgi:hypothetical protein